MKVLVFNASPRKNGNVSKTLKMMVDRYSPEEAEIFSFNVNDLDFKTCCGCMACRSKGECVYKDEASKIAELVKECDLLFVGTPVYWGNMSGQLKRLFDRLVYVLMTENKMAIPVPLNKGKKAFFVTSCTTPFPFNYLCGQTTGCIRALKEVVKTGGFKICKMKNISGTKK